MAALIYDSTSQAFKEAGGAKVYSSNDSAFVDAGGKVWNGSEWVDVWNNILWLYNNGDECTDITGGWNLTEQKGNTFGSKDSTSLRIYNSTISASNGATFTTARAIDVSNYTTLGLKVKTASKASGFAGLAYSNNTYITIDMTNGSLYSGSIETDYNKTLNDDGSYTITVNIANVSTSAVARFTSGFGWGGDGQEIRLYEMYLK